MNEIMGSEYLNRVWAKLGAHICFATMLTMILISNAYAIDMSMTGSSGSASLAFSSGNDDAVRMTATLSQDSLQNSISGNGSLVEEHWVKTIDGHRAGIGVNLTDAKNYVYSYNMEPGAINATATMKLDVEYANGIDAWSEARKPIKSSVGNAGSMIAIERGSLKEYITQAGVRGDDLYSHQKFSQAEGDVVKVESWGRNEFMETKVATDVANGILTDHLGMSQVTNTNIKTLQATHIDLSPEKGSFTSSTSSKYHDRTKKSTRRSDYGTNYDLVAIAVSSPDKKNMMADEHLTYYVDVINPKANKIQGAVDAAASSGDSIKIASGTYKENLVIRDKSLILSGTGADKTVIDGQGKGRVITNRGKFSEDKIDANTYLVLDGLALTNGIAEYGGGICNSGVLALNNVKISSNRALQDGGGVYNTGETIIRGGEIKSNDARFGGGVYNKEGIVIFDGGKISSNNASENGGGVWNDGTFLMDNGSIEFNQAKNKGGALMNKGTFTIDNGTISNNSAYYGGAIYNDHAWTFLNGGNISHNRANETGGILDAYTFRGGVVVRDNPMVVHDNEKGNLEYSWWNKTNIIALCMLGVIVLLAAACVIGVAVVGLDVVIAVAFNLILDALEYIGIGIA